MKLLTGITKMLIFLVVFFNFRTISRQRIFGQTKTLVLNSLTVHLFNLDHNLLFNLKVVVM